MSEKRDYYQILEIDKNATQDEIKNSYQKLATEWNPEKFREFSKCEDGSCGLEKASEKWFCSPRCQNIYKKRERKFKEINEAYETLSDPQKRKEHDLKQSDKNNHHPNSNHSKDSNNSSLKIGWGGGKVAAAIIFIGGLLIFLKKSAF